MRIIMSQECANGRHDACEREVRGRSRHGTGVDVWRCGCDCAHGAKHAPATVAEAYDKGFALHPADLFGGSRRA
jgi:hypothetical protein